MQRHSGGGEKFTEEQMEWLRMVRDHVIASFHVDVTIWKWHRSIRKAEWGACISCLGREWTT